MANVHSEEEILPKVSIPWVGCTNVTDRQTTGGFAIAKTPTWT